MVARPPIVRGALVGVALGASLIATLIALYVVSPAETAPRRGARAALALVATPGHLVNDLLGTPIPPPLRALHRTPSGGGCKLVESAWWPWWVYACSLAFFGLVGSGIGWASRPRVPAGWTEDG